VRDDPLHAGEQVAGAEYGQGQRKNSTPPASAKARKKSDDCEQNTADDQQDHAVASQRVSECAGELRVKASRLLNDGNHSGNGLRGGLSDDRWRSRAFMLHHNRAQQCRFRGSQCRRVKGEFDVT
jgi:hypothetical protein